MLFLPCSEIEMQLFYLVFYPAVGNLWSAPVSQHIVFHALHTGVLSDFRAKWRFVILNLCKDTHMRRSDNLTYDLCLYDSMKNHCWRAFGREKYWGWKLEASPEWGKERMFHMLWFIWSGKKHKCGIWRKMGRNQLLHQNGNNKQCFFVGHLFCSQEQINEI